jgi:hypothetical protein
MQYLLMLYGDQSTWKDQSDTEHGVEMSAFAAFERQARNAGVWVTEHALQPAENAATVRRSNGGEPTVSDGPLAENKEQMGAFYILECRDLDEATDWAKKVPLVGAGGFSAVEVRPMLTGTPY